MSYTLAAALFLVPIRRPLGGPYSSCWKCHWQVNQGHVSGAARKATTAIMLMYCIPFPMAQSVIIMHLFELPLVYPNNGHVSGVFSAAKETKETAKTCLAQITLISNCCSPWLAHRRSSRSPVACRPLGIGTLACRPSNPPPQRPARRIGGPAHGFCGT